MVKRRVRFRADVDDEMRLIDAADVLVARSDGLVARLDAAVQALTADLLKEPT